MNRFLYIFLLIPLFVASCKDVPRASNSLCAGPKPVKCYAPEPYFAGAPPRPQANDCLSNNSCGQNKYVMPGDNAPLPRRGVEFAPVNPQAPPSQQQRPQGSSLDIKINTGVNTGDAFQEQEDAPSSQIALTTPVFVKPPEYKEYSAKANELDSKIANLVPSINTKKINKSAMLNPYEQVLYTKSATIPLNNEGVQEEEKQAIKAVPNITKTTSSIIKDSAPSIQEQYSLENFKKNNPNFFSNTSREDIKYQKYNFAEASSNASSHTEDVEKPAEKLETKTEPSIEKPVEKNSEQKFLDPNPSTSIKDSVIDDEDYQRNKEEQKKEIAPPKEIKSSEPKLEQKKVEAIRTSKENPEIPKLPPLPSF
ncbi:MAG: hypothetical protein ACK5BE_03530 [Alphaproteobacteria bacterium]|jgi:hypothetical protein